jgi:hypothetical protein|tara:strand:+ start:400 stop:702 length:303 start_codon:yes stop_codon:yes gene_type:complete
MSDWANDLLDEEVAVEEPEHEVVETASLAEVRHKLMALLAMGLEGAIFTAEARDMEPNDIKVVGDLVRALKTIDDMQKDDALSQLSDEELEKLARETLGK